jgi:hypothetical protein
MQRLPLDRTRHQQTPGMGELRRGGFVDGRGDTYYRTSYFLLRLPWLYRPIFDLNQRIGPTLWRDTLFLLVYRVLYRAVYRFFIR